MLTDREEVPQERRADLASEKTSGLKKAGERKHVDRTAERPGIYDLKNDGTHQSVECEGQANGHDRLR